MLLTNLTSRNWKLKLGLVDLAYLLEKESDINTLHYGVALGFDYQYVMENKNVLGAELFGGAQFLTMSKDPDKSVPVLADLEGAAKYSIASLSKNLFIRLGFNAIITGKSDQAPLTAGVLDNFYSPFVGVKFEQFALGPILFDIGADWLAGHLFYNNVKAAAGAAINVAIPFAELEKVKLNLNIGLRDKFFLKDEGMENRASLILAIGVENVVR